VKLRVPRAAYIFGSVLALSHVAFYFFVMSRNFEGSWGGFLIFLVDLPASLLALLLSNAPGMHSEYVFLIIGTAWWFFVGLLISKVFIFVAAKDERAAAKAMKR
jgi:hypothetical protein